VAVRLLLANQPRLRTTLQPSKGEARQRCRGRGEAGVERRASAVCLEHRRDDQKRVPECPEPDCPNPAALGYVCEGQQHRQLGQHLYGVRHDRVRHLEGACTTERVAALEIIRTPTA